MIVLHHTTSTILSIYVIIRHSESEDPIVYIGKTRTSDLRKVLYYHRRKKKLAAPLFDSDTAPEIHLLETIEANKSIIYKHYIAWIRHFLENEYDVICPLGVYEDAYDLHPNTEEIYSRISKASIEELLAKPYVSPKAIKPQPSLSTPSKSSARLSIRIRQGEYDSFAKFCCDNGFTQREGFLLLLSFANESLISNTLIQEQKDTITALNAQIDKLRQIPRGIKADQRLKECFAFQQQGINQYIDYLFQEHCFSTPAHCCSWNYIDDLVFDRKDYHYPQCSGFFLFQFHSMCYGRNHHNNAPLFLYGTDVNSNTPVLLRYYAKPEFLGLRPPNNSLYQSGAIFLAGCQVKDGVADMYSAFPISISNNSTYEDAPEQVALSFEDILLDATRRSRG